MLTVDGEREWMEEEAALSAALIDHEDEEADMARGDRDSTDCEEASEEAAGDARVRYAGSDEDSTCSEADGRVVAADSEWIEWSEWTIGGWTGSSESRLDSLLT